MRSIKTVPKLYLSKFNEKLSNSIPTNELFVKFGFLNNPRAGLVHWLPIGLLMLNKLRNVVNKRLQEKGAEEVSLSILSHSSLWKKTGRWGNTELFKLKDSNDQDFCLTATSEEEVTNLVKNTITSYKDLPLIYYQIHEKFRDEKRPRMGLLRSREFLMKDAYSFDVNEVEAMNTYETIVQLYHLIFQDLKIPYVKADADSGDIGGSLSHEWHYNHPSGEDTLFSCSHCDNVSNIEKTLSLPSQIRELSISEKFLQTDENTYIKAIYPTDREFNINLLKNQFPKIEEIDFTPNNYTVLNDSRISSDGIPMVSSEEGETCFNCKTGHLEKKRAIEVGHTFYLGTKYSKPLDLTIQIPENGKLVDKHVVMGCYGIGLSRIIASIAEITRDEKGFSWPAIISPWHVTVIESHSLTEDVSQVYQQLGDSTIDYRLDDRNANLNKKINQSNMIGIPLVIILGKSFPMVEIEVRGKRYSNTWESVYDEKTFEWEITEKAGIEKHLVHHENLTKVIKTLIADM